MRLGQRLKEKQIDHNKNGKINRSWQYPSAVAAEITEAAADKILK